MRCVVAHVNTTEDSATLAVVLATPPEEVVAALEAAIAATAVLAALRTPRATRVSVLTTQRLHTATITVISV